MVGPVHERVIFRRFELALPEDGAGEVVIGGNGLAKVRYRLHGVERAPVNDLGDIHLPSPLTVTVRLMAPGCDLHAVGPLGSLGLELVRGLFDPTSSAHRMVFPEPGFWWLEAQCGAQARTVQPPVLQLGPDDSARVVELRLSDDDAPP